MDVAFHPTNLSWLAHTTDNEIRITLWIPGSSELGQPSSSIVEMPIGTHIVNIIGNSQLICL